MPSSLTSGSLVGRAIASDEEAMALAIRLSKHGWPAPNPHVGCVLVNGGNIVGSGWHDFAGGPHAEAVALVEAGGRAAGAEAFVTLEPCSHFGRTPPCSRALIEAGVARVVYAIADPNPRAKGGGVALAEAGVAVESGLMAAEAFAANRWWLTAMGHRRPFVVAKAAMSLDGRIALPNGESEWITGSAARRRGRELRAECGAVLVGARTAEIDDPSLTVRIPRIRCVPRRIVLDPHRRLNESLKLFASSDLPTTRIVGRGLARAQASSEDGQSPWQELEVPLMEGDRLDLACLLNMLFEDGVTSLLVEGGGNTIGGFIEAGLVDEIHAFIAGKVLLGGPSWAEGRIESLAQASGWTLDRVRRIGGDLETVWRSDRAQA